MSHAGITRLPGKSTSNRSDDTSFRGSQLLLKLLAHALSIITVRLSLIRSTYCSSSALAAHNIGACPWKSPVLRGRAR